MKEIKKWDPSSPEVKEAIEKLKNRYRKASFCDATILDAYCDTNVPQGGDGGHGGFARVGFHYQGSELEVSFGEGEVHSSDRVEIWVCGDAEARTLADALEWAAKQLKDLIEANSTANSSGVKLDDRP